MILGDFLMRLEEINERGNNRNFFFIFILKETGENNPSVLNSPQQSISQPSSGSSNNRDSITNIYNTYVTNANNTDAQTSSKDGVTHLDNTGITGGVIGSLLSGGNIIISLVILSGLFIAFIISRKIIKLKR